MAISTNAKIRNLRRIINSALHENFSELQAHVFLTELLPFIDKEFKDELVVTKGEIREAAEVVFKNKVDEMRTDGRRIKLYIADTEANRKMLMELFKEAISKDEKAG